MGFTISLRQAAISFLLMGSVVTAQIDNRHNGDLVQREAVEGKRSLFDYVDGIVERVAAAAAATETAGKSDIIEIEALPLSD